MYSALLSLNHAIARLGEKALGSGGKSEDQPLSVKCRTTLDVRAKRCKFSFYWLSAAMRTYVYYYISSTDGTASTIRVHSKMVES